MAEVKDRPRRPAPQPRRGPTEINQAMREIDAHAADIRRSGQDPEAIKAQIGHR
jgi:hypothetical protein